MIKFMQIIAVSSLLLFSNQVLAESPDTNDPDNQVVMTALEWLELVDQRNIQESWNQASSYFKGIVNEDQWSAAILPVIEPLGSVKSRALNKQQYFETLPGSPDGEYLVMLFNTSYENKSEAVETVTFVLDNDGQWRIAGYYIK